MKTEHAFILLVDHRDPTAADKDVIGCGGLHGNDGGRA